MQTKCEICNENERKYKCKTCTIPYCSVQCYRVHQEKPCEPPKPAQEPGTAVQFREDRQPAKPLLFTTVDTVPQEKLELLGQSEHLKNLLANRHLRQLLQEVDCGWSGMNAIKVAMMEPLFVEFADECLRLVEPPEQEDDGNLDQLVFTNRLKRK
uniref:Zinc finger HIT domain-containing protein 3 n=1 Tax=Anopheles marajoara TaxID=58244 RepID=A0A2M4C301_9DIPT